MAVFEETFMALSCTAEMQMSIGEHNKVKPENLQFQVRMGCITEERFLKRKIYSAML